MSLFNFKKKEEVKTDVSNPNEGITPEMKADIIRAELGLRADLDSKVDVDITFGEGSEEGSIEVTRGDEKILIPSYQFLFKRDHNGTDSKYRIIGIGGSMIINEAELDYIYNSFKDVNTP